MITDRIEFVDNNPLFLGCLIGVLGFKAIFSDEGIDPLLARAFATYPMDYGYTAVIKHLDQETFDRIVEELKLREDPENPEGNHIDVLERALSMKNIGLFSELLLALHYGVVTADFEKSNQARIRQLIDIGERHCVPVTSDTLDNVFARLKPSKVN